MQLGSVIFANKPGDGSAREQAASCQRVLGGCANICYEFATKRYRSNCVNWGMLPFTLEPYAEFTGCPGDFIYVPMSSAEWKPETNTSRQSFCERTARGRADAVSQKHICRRARLLLRGCLMNHYAAQRRGVTMEKIKMQNAIAELDGDEMTHVLWGMIKDELILPFVELNVSITTSPSRTATKQKTPSP